VLAKERLLTLFEDVRSGLLAAIGGLVVMAVAVCVVVAAVRVAMTLGMIVALGFIADTSQASMCILLHFRVLIVNLNFVTGSTNMGNYLTITRHVLRPSNIDIHILRRD
jgi:ABC-type transport system involved in cytochrome bd biosynthesis fused ATPase/permease subunit